jgi:hypothetical protein
MTIVLRRPNMIVILLSKYSAAGSGAVSIPSLWFFQPSQVLAMSQFAFSVIPVEAGSQRVCWLLAFVGMTENETETLFTFPSPCSVRGLGTYYTSSALRQVF